MYSTQLPRFFVLRFSHVHCNQGWQPFVSFPDTENLPRVFRWQHPATRDEVIVMNERGYGTEIVLERGFNFDHALRWYFVGK